MITVRQMERAWTARQYERLYQDLVAVRPEAAFGPQFEGGWSTPTAALALIRMDELCQGHTPLFGTLLRAVIAAQQPDGGWGDVATTALCVRALLCGGGQGIAVDRGVAFLAKLQKENGLWPNLPHRRLPDDPQVSAVVLYHLAGEPAFQAGVRLDAAVAWFEQNAAFLDEPARTIWSRLARRCRPLAAA